MWLTLRNNNFKRQRHQSKYCRLIIIPHNAVAIWLIIKIRRPQWFHFCPATAVSMLLVIFFALNNPCVSLSLIYGGDFSSAHNCPDKITFQSHFYGGLIQLSYISTFLGKVRHVRYTKVLKYVSFKYDPIRCTLHGIKMAPYLLWSNKGRFNTSLEM